MKVWVVIHYDGSYPIEPVVTLYGSETSARKAYLEVATPIAEQDGLGWDEQSNDDGEATSWGPEGAYANDYDGVSIEAFLREVHP